LGPPFPNILINDTIVIVYAHAIVPSMNVIVSTTAIIRLCRCIHSPPSNILITNDTSTTSFALVAVFAIAGFHHLRSPSNTDVLHPTPKAVVLAISETLRQSHVLLLCRDAC
jgi:hypothetical protein